MKNKHGQYAWCLIALVILAAPTILHAQFGGALKPFGGRVTSTLYCNDGMLLLIKQPIKGTEWFFWRYGNLPYLMHIVPHTNQWLLGKANSVKTQCYLGDDYLGEGKTIQYHGSGF
jgi:hypothetical protein